MQITSILQEEHGCVDLGRIITFFNSTNLGEKNIRACQKTCWGLTETYNWNNYLQSALRIPFQKVLGQEGRAKQVKSHLYWPPSIKTYLDIFIWSAR